MAAGKDMTFIIMENVFYTQYKIHEQYDLKGSTVDRQVSVDASQLATVARKDLDFHHRIRLGPRRKAKFMEQIERDCKWLESHNICDYSLLIGIHFLPHESDDQSYSPPPADTNPSNTSDFRLYYGGLLSACAPYEIYFISIIDTLTEYNLKKAGEHHLKSLLYDSTQISAIPPTPYRERFVRYVESIVE